MTHARRSTDPLSAPSVPARARSSAVHAALALALAFAAGAPAAHAQSAAPAADPALAAALAGPQRSAANKARDAARHPAEMLAFFGIRPDQTVIEISPGGGWFTEVLAPYLREHGKLYVAAARADDPEPGARRGRASYEAKLQALPAVYDKVTVGSMPAPSGQFTDIAPPGGADAVLTFRNVHNWIEGERVDPAFKAFYAVLKPGGVLGIEDHRAKPGTPVAQMIATGYVTEDYVIEHAKAAGFEFAGKSEVNANPKDTKDHPNGVWSLPPTLAGKDDTPEQRAAYKAIGESDRFTLKFVKPSK